MTRRGPGNPGDRRGGEGWLGLVLLLSLPGLMFLVAGLVEFVHTDYFYGDVWPRWWRRLTEISLTAGIYSPPTTVAAVAVALVASRKAARPSRLWMRIIAGGAVLGSLWIWGILGLFGGVR